MGRMTRQHLIALDLDELKILCATYEPTAVCVVETWLSEEISDANISIPDYSVIRLDRNRHGGGIAIYVRNNVMVNTLLYSPSGLEFMLVSLCNFTCKLCIGLLYRPPSSPASVFETLYFHLLQINVNSFSNFVLLGDLQQFISPFVC